MAAKSVSPTPPPDYAVPSSKIGKSSSMDSLDSDTREDLQIQLDTELQRIIQLYSRYVSCIRESLQAKGITPKDIRSDLMSVSAFNHTEQKTSLLSAHEAELVKAVDLNDIFDLLVKEYASFLNYEVFQFILDKYRNLIHCGQDEFKYPEHLEAYINKHKISEFIEINPLLEKFTVTLKQLILKFDIATTAKLAKLKKLKTAVAKMLGLRSAALRLLDIEEGCVVATFLIPSPVAELVFNQHTTFSREQVEEFRALLVLWLKCNDCSFYFSAREHTNQKEEVQSDMFIRLSPA